MAVTRSLVNVPYVEGRIMIGNEIMPWSGEFEDVFSPIVDERDNNPILIGKLPRMDESTTLQAVEYAKIAWHYGRGEWPQKSFKERIEVINNLVTELCKKRDAIINLLCWEICKTYKEAADEFDRTMNFVDLSIKELNALLQQEFCMHESAEMFGKVLRCPIGIMLAMGPSNYPFNETYTSLIPALLMGNVVILKVPAVGGLVHAITQECFAQLFPKGVVNFVYGPGKDIAVRIMHEEIDIFSFVGSSGAADALLREHPAPHKLKSNLSLDGKNVAIVMESADLERTADQVLAGALTFNGQRCTALKLVFVHQSVVEQFLHILSPKVDSLVVGLPWERDVMITPCDYKKFQHLQDLVSDATQKGASVINNKGRVLVGNLMEPLLLFPVNEAMKIWKEEQFGPIIAVAPYSDLEDLFSYVATSSSGLQCSIFGSIEVEMEYLSKMMLNSVGRVNINVQCTRSPDEFPFTGRKSSANGIISSSEVLKAFSLPVVVASKENFFEKEKLDKFLSEMN